MAADHILRIVLQARDWRAIAAHLKMIPPDRPIGRQAAEVILAECGEYSDAVSIPVERATSSWIAITNADTDCMAMSSKYREASAASDQAWGKLYAAVSRTRNRAESRGGGQ